MCLQKCAALAPLLYGLILHSSPETLLNSTSICRLFQTNALTTPEVRVWPTRRCTSLMGGGGGCLFSGGGLVLRVELAGCVCT